MGPRLDPIIQTEGLEKWYGELRAVAGIDFRVFRGECFGILGPNGAGKTTTVRMLYGYVPRSRGELRVFGRDISRHPRAIKARIGVCHQEENLDPDFSVRKNLTVYGRYFGLPRRQAAGRADELLEFMGLTEKRDATMTQISGGMKRRLLFARALLNSPDLLILDEPTTGLDPQSRHQVWSRVRSLKRTGTTILLTTHYLEEAEQLCDRIVIMDHGRILVEGPPEDLVRDHIGRDVVEVWGAEADLLAHVRDSGWTHEVLADRVMILTNDGDGVHRELAGRFKVEQLHLRRANLEDVFLKLTGRGLRD